MDSISTPELDTSFGEDDAMPSSVSSGFLHLVSAISDTSRAQLTPSINLINDGARLGLCFCLYHRQV